jgi:pimeloyl-ACP methyl ester carboxylesterase
MSGWRKAALLLVVVAAAGCGRARVSGGGGVPATPSACVRLQSQRQVRGQTLCEDAFSCYRPPNGESDRIGLRRIAPCGAGGGPVVLYFPGMHMNGEISGTSANYDFRLYLAQAGFRIWSLDYRTHAVRADASPEQLQALSAWTRDTFLEDAEWAATFVRGVDPGPLFLAGFSYGAGIAYAIVARGNQPVEGLIILDGVPGGSTIAPESGGSAIDVAGSQLSYPDREKLLQAVIRSPDNPSPVGGGTAGTELAQLLYSSPSYGGQGGLSAARDGVSDVRVVALLLDSYDRWWPRAAMEGPAKGPRKRLPVLAFASENMGPAWVARVKQGAEEFGGDHATVKTLPLHGHLDVLVGRLASPEVFEPTRRWLIGPR